MSKFVLFVAGLFGLAVLPSESHALTFMCDAQEMGSNQWRYEYTVVNSSDYDILGFTIAFDNSVFSNLTVSSVAEISTQWDELFMPYSAGTTLYDAYAQGSGVVSGGSGEGFAVTFEYSGADVSAAQYFEVYDPQDFSVIASGWTIPIPEPATILLLTAGLFAIKKINN